MKTAVPLMTKKTANLATCTLLLLLVTVTSIACKHLKIQQRYTINQATIQNVTNGTLHNVHVRHEPTGAIGNTNSILPMCSFNVGFEGRTMMADSGTLSWTDDHGTYHTQTLLLPENVDKDPREKHLIYRIDRGNIVTVNVINSSASTHKN